MTTSRKNWILRASLLGGVGLLFFCLFILKTDSAWTKVKLIINQGDDPSVTVEPIPEGVKLVSNLTCLPPEFIERYRKEEINSRDNAAARCATGYMAATILRDKIADTSFGIERMKLMLSSLERTRQYFETARKENSFDVWAIPAGLSVEKKYDRADSVTIQCLKDSSGNIISQSTPVGTLVHERGPFFEKAPQSQLDKMTELRDKNRKTGAELVKLGTSGEAPGIAKSIFLGKTIQGIQQEVAKITIPITEAELIRYYPEFKNNTKATMGMSINIKTLGDGGERITPEWAALEATKTILGFFGIKDALYSATMNVDGSVYDFPNMVIPYNYGISQALESIAEHKQRLDKLKTKFEQLLQKLQASYDKLKSDNFNCG